MAIICFAIYNAHYKITSTRSYGLNFIGYSYGWLSPLILFPLGEDHLNFIEITFHCYFLWKIAHL